MSPHLTATMPSSVTGKDQHVIITPPRSSRQSPEMTVVPQPSVMGPAMEGSGLDMSMDSMMPAAPAENHGDTNLYASELPSFMSLITSVVPSELGQPATHNESNVTWQQDNITASNPESLMQSSVKHETQQEEQKPVAEWHGEDAWQNPSNMPALPLRNKMLDDVTKRFRSESMQSELSHAFSDALPPIPSNNSFLIDVSVADMMNTSSGHLNHAQHLHISPEHTHQEHSDLMGYHNYGSNDMAADASLEDVHSGSAAAAAAAALNQDVSSMFMSAAAQQTLFMGEHGLYFPPFQRSASNPIFMPGAEEVQNGQFISAASTPTPTHTGKMPSRRRATSVNASARTDRVEFSGEKEWQYDPVSKRYNCPRPMCSKSYKNPNGLKYHLEHGNCEREFESLEQYEREKNENAANNMLLGVPNSNTGEILTAAGHAIRITHRPYICQAPGCGRRYKNLNGLKYHGTVCHPYLRFEEIRGDHH